MGLYWMQEGLDPPKERHSEPSEEGYMLREAVSDKNCL